MDRWLALNTAKLWLRGIIVQGERVLAVQVRIEQQATSAEFSQTMQEQIRSVQNRIRAMQERVIEEHFFVISVNKTINWLKEVSKLEPLLQANVERFLDQVPSAKEVRNMREHDIEYFKGEGFRQEEFQKTIDVNQQEDAGRIDATATIICNEGYLIGGRLNVEQAMAAAQELDPLIPAE